MIKLSKKGRCCKNFELCIFATVGKIRNWNTFKLQHVTEARIRGLDCSLGKSDFNLFSEYGKLKEFNGVCEVRLEIKEILTPLIQEIKNKFPKNKI